MTEDQIRELFRKMRDEAVPPDSRARVRFGVMERIQTRNWRTKLHRGWRLAAALLFSAFIVGVVILTRTSKMGHEPAPPIAARHSAAPLETARPIEKTTAPPTKMLRRAKHGVRQSVQPGLEREPPTASDPVLIRIETPDPDVVILLVGD